ncbi:hypothetical protein SCB49_07182 [unidentified eubacterium SCB49]|nr:hypothetical protein SCB49_07182 [unidentified eubacterium SCB49]
MKIFIYIIIALSSILLIFNLIKVDWNNPLMGDSSIALIGVFAAASGIALMSILLVSKNIEKKNKK